MTIKFRIMSDLHLEFEPSNTETYPIPYIGEDYLILAGDIQVGIKKKRWFKRLLKHRSVIYVAGNHEFYNQDFDIQRRRMRAFQGWVNESAHRKGYPGLLTFLDNSSFKAGFIAGDSSTTVKVIGSTLWSNIDPANIANIMLGMNDYHLISKDGKKLKPVDTCEEFTRSVKFISDQVSAQGSDVDKTLVITHHAPSFLSVAEQFKGDNFNSAYASSLEYLMGNVDLWVHGHTHTSFDYNVGNCRVVCNPKGYRDQNEDFNIDKVVEL